MRGVYLGLLVGEVSIGPHGSVLLLSLVASYLQLVEQRLLLFQPVHLRPLEQLPESVVLGSQLLVRRRSAGVRFIVFDVVEEPGVGSLQNWFRGGYL